MERKKDFKTYIIFRNDDFCALSDVKHERAILKLFAKHDFPQVQAVIPNVVEDPHNCDLDQNTHFHPLKDNPEMVSLIQEYRNKGLIDVALHGYTHQTNKYFPNDVSEVTKKDSYKGIDRKWLAYKPSKGAFSEFKSLSVPMQEEKVVNGKEYLERTLDTTIESFVFPWNTFDLESLKLLRANKFKHVLAGSEDFHNIFRLNTIYNCCENINDLPQKISQLDAYNCDRLIHVVYHSWMLTEDDIKGLKKTLNTIAKKDNCEVITINDLSKKITYFPLIQHLNFWARLVTKKVQYYFQDEQPLTKFYLVKPTYYLHKIVKAVGIFIYGKLRRLPKGILALLVIFILFVLVAFIF